MDCIQSMRVRVTVFYYAPALLLLLSLLPLWSPFAAVSTISAGVHPPSSVDADNPYPPAWPGGITLRCLEREVLLLLASYRRFVDVPTGTSYQHDICLFSSRLLLPLLSPFVCL